MVHLARTRAALGILAIVLSAGLTTGPAWAEDKKAAKEHWERGTKYYELGKYDEAIKEFEAAYEAGSDPLFLYNIAQSHRLAGRPAQALRLYRNYVAKAPDGPYSADSKQKIKALEKAVAEKSPTEPAPSTGTTTPPPAGTETPPVATTPPAPPVTPAPATPPAAGSTWPAPAATPPPFEQPPGTYGQPGAGAMPPATYPGAPAAPAPTDGGSDRRRLGLIVAGSGGGVMVVGAIFGLVARAQSNKVEEAAANRERFDPSVEKLGKTAEVIQWIGYGVGAAAVATGLILYATAPTGAEAGVQPRVAVAPLAAPGLGGALVRVAF